MPSVNDAANRSRAVTFFCELTMTACASKIIANLEEKLRKPGIPAFRTGDTIKVHVRIIEGNKERVQVFQGIVIRRHRKNHPMATFTVRKVSFNIGVERTFLLNSPRVEKIELVNRGEVRRSRLFYLRPLRGKKSKVRSTTLGIEGVEEAAASTESTKS